MKSPIDCLKLCHCPNPFYSLSLMGWCKLVNIQFLRILVLRKERKVTTLNFWIWKAGHIRGREFLIWSLVHCCQCPSVLTNPFLAVSSMDSSIQPFLLQLKLVLCLGSFGQPHLPWPPSLVLLLDTQSRLPSFPCHQLLCQVR